MFFCSNEWVSGELNFPLNVNLTLNLILLYTSYFLTSTLVTTASNVVSTLIMGNLIFQHHLPCLVSYKIVVNIVPHSPCVFFFSRLFISTMRSRHGNDLISEKKKKLRVSFGALENLSDFFFLLRSPPPLFFFCKTDTVIVLNLDVINVQHLQH